MKAESSVTLFVNGDRREVQPGALVTDLLASLKLEAGVLVELNGRALFPKEWRETGLVEGDRVEIIRVVAGG